MVSNGELGVKSGAGAIDSRFRIVLFGVSGFANPVMEALIRCADQVDLQAVFTPHFDEPYPYYNVESLEQCCLRTNTVCYSQIKPSSEEGLAILTEIKPDLIIVSSFYEILRQSVLSIPTFGIVNIHPSLLPKWRGRHPTKSALLSGDTESGVTFHYLTETVDTGDILLQSRCQISATETDSSLRMKLAALAGDSIPEFISLLQLHDGRPPALQQDENQVSNCPKINYDRLTLETSPSVEICIRRIKAMTKFPGAFVVVDGEKTAVREFERLEESQLNGLYKGKDCADLFVGGEGIRLFYDGK